MPTYRTYYVKYSPHVGQGSAEILRLYNQGQRWTPIPGKQFALEVDPPFLFTIDRLLETHVFLWEMDAPSRDALYHLMQADRMDPEDYHPINARVAEFGLTHLSMSAGDVIEDLYTGEFWECELFTGWRKLD